MYVPCDIQPNEIHFVKIIASDELREPMNDPSQSPLQLNVEGFSQDGDVIFNYENKNQQFSQRFGFNLRYYIAGVVKDYRLRNNGSAEGAYTFKVDMDNLRPLQYSTLDQDVAYEHGYNLDQWTIKFMNL